MVAPPIRDGAVCISGDGERVTDLALYGATELLLVILDGVEREAPIFEADSEGEILGVAEPALISPDAYPNSEVEGLIS